MPYTIAQLLEAVRTDHPEFRKVPDHTLLEALAKDHPELTKNTVEVQRHLPPAPPTEPTRTPWTAAREGILGVTDALGLTGSSGQAPTHNMYGFPITASLDPLKNAAEGILTQVAKRSPEYMIRHPLETVQSIPQEAKGIYNAVTTGPSEMAQGIHQSDPDLFMHGLGGTAAVTAPMIEGGVQGAQALMKATKIPSVPLFTKHFAKAGDLSFQKYAPGILDELKTGDASTIEAGLDTLKKRFDLYEKGSKHYLDPHREVPIDEYRDVIRQRALAAIPETATNLEKAKAIRLIDQRIPKNLTIGNADALRMESNARVKTGNLNISKGLAADMTTQAIEEALAGGARDVISNAMDQKGLGGGEAVRLLHSRIGNTIHGEDALLAQKNAAVAQRAISPAQNLANKASRYTSKVPVVNQALKLSGVGSLATAAPLTIDEALSMAVKNHPTYPSEISSQLRASPGPHFERLPRVEPPPPSQRELSEMAPHNVGYDYPDLFGIDATGIPPQYPKEGLQFGFGEGIEQTPAPPVPPPVEPMHEVVPGGLSYPKSDTEIFNERTANRDPRLEKLKRIMRLGKE